MYKRIIGLIVVLLLVVSIPGCLGGGAPPDFANQTAKLDLAVQQYGHAKTLYQSGNYTEAKASFVDVIGRFKDNKTAFETISKQDVGNKKKYIAQNLARNCDQYAQAAAYMRDAADAATKGNKDNAYQIELSAEEFEQAARLNYEASKEDMRGVT